MRILKAKYPSCHILIVAFCLINRRKSEIFVFYSGFAFRTVGAVSATIYVLGCHIQLLLLQYYRVPSTESLNRLGVM